jgi:hypothetical protein
MRLAALIASAKMLKSHDETTHVRVPIRAAETARRLRESDPKRYRTIGRAIEIALDEEAARQSTPAKL